ncbi:MAG: class I tRNA ligase family protein, partial [Patescibacteria group bacterium]
MTQKYQPQEFERKWVDAWDKEKTYSTNYELRTTNSKKSYVLAMFPYPSGAGLHVGHVRNYTGTDVVARYFRMNGHSVLHPMGWDAFGLPAENAAVKAKKNPMDMVPEHIATFKKQMKSLGFSYDWDREFATTDPNYYKWTQWLFIQFYKMGLLYKKNAPINYCPKCKTGLAEEEVLPDGTHERCGNKIEKRNLPQWVFKITKYADRLLSDLEGLDWPKGILEMQRNWIGRKEGINIDYKIKGSNKIITCFTTRPDTNFGATFIVIAPEHEFVKKINNEDVKKYIKETAS